MLILQPIPHKPKRAPICHGTGWIKKMALVEIVGLIRGNDKFCHECGANQTEVKDIERMPEEKSKQEKFGRIWYVCLQVYFRFCHVSYRIVH